MRELTLRDLFNAHNGRQIDKWAHYLPIYEKHFERFRGKKIRLLEIGVDHGGSLQLWKRYFGPDAQIIGIDINPDAMFTEDQIDTMEYNQCDPSLAAHGPFDIVIDDGSHFVEHQTISFEHLWPRTTGVYLIEDCQGWQLAPGTNNIHCMSDCYPEVRNIGGLKYQYPWVVVYERPHRMIRGTPSRELRADEAETRTLFGPR